MRALRPTTVEPPVNIDRIGTFLVPPRWVFVRVEAGGLEGWGEARPRLGVNVDEAAMRSAAANPHRWRNRVWRQADGRYAEW